MTNEEKKAIDKLKNGRKYTLVEIIRVFKKEGIENFRITRKEYLETILKLLEKQDNRIKELESDNYECNNIIVRYMEELEFKDKMIELILEELTDCEFEMKCSECCCECEKDYDQLYECNKQYFENKAKESGEIDEDNRTIE